MRHNRASPASLCFLYATFTEDQINVIIQMGFRSMTRISCPNLDNNLCLWLGNRYDPASRCLVIPGRGRIKLDEALVFCTMGLPRGPLDVPYRIDREIEPKLFSYLYPEHGGLQPMVSHLWDELSKIRTHGKRFKMLFLHYLISAVLAPTTSLRVSNRCYPVLVCYWIFTLLIPSLCN